jgi:hypothetical protein
LLSVIQTCRAQARSVLQFFQHALMATSGADDDLLMPSLIPDLNT